MLDEFFDALWGIGSRMILVPGSDELLDPRRGHRQIAARNHPLRPSFPYRDRAAEGPGRDRPNPSSGSRGGGRSWCQSKHELSDGIKQRIAFGRDRA